MMSYTCSLFNKMCIGSGRRTVITAATKEIQDTCTSSFRVAESYPPEHNESHLNRIYTVPPDITELFKENLPRKLQKQITVLREFGILVRKPAIEIISCLEQTDYTKSINKYVLYGNIGVGKTTTLCHLIHYGVAKQYIVVHLPWVLDWFRFPSEVKDSPLVPGLLDVPKRASLWLKYFKKLNELSLSRYNLKISKEYTWSQKEATKSGNSFFDLIDFGIHRTKFACGVIDALINELKIASTAGKCRTLIVIDGFNVLTANYTPIRDANRVHVPAEKISITSSFFNSVDYTWCNGAAILTVDTIASRDRREYVYPKYLLGKKGFEHLDPFLPISVENYSFEEFKSIIEYYDDRKWIRNINREGQREIELLSNKNPLTVWEYCKAL